VLTLFEPQIMQVQSVQLALPTIGEDLNIRTTNLQWLVRPARPPLVRRSDH